LLDEDSSSDDTTMSIALPNEENSTSISTSLSSQQQKAKQANNK